MAKFDIMTLLGLTPEGAAINALFGPVGVLGLAGAQLGGSFGSDFWDSLLKATLGGGIGTGVAGLGALGLGGGGAAAGGAGGTFGNVASGGSSTAPAAGGVGGAMDPGTGMMLGSLLSGALSGAGSIIGGAQSQGDAPSINDIITLLAAEYKASPTNISAALQQLSGQASYGTGASADAIALDLMTRQIESAAHPQLARKFQARFQGLQTLLAQQQANPSDPKIQRLIDQHLGVINNIIRKAGVGTVNVVNGRATISLNDPSLQALVNKAAADSALIQNNRLTGQRNLSQLAADFPMATAADIDKLTEQERIRQEREINERYGLETDRILADANTRGFNPAGVLGELEKQRTQDLFDTQFTATDRALQVLGGKQTLATGSITGTNLALSPDSTIAILNALRGQQAPTTGQLAAAQAASLTNLSANNAGNVGSSIAGAGQALGDALMLMTLLGSKGPASQGATG